MFTYAIYIPNTWRRAAVVTGMMAAAPIVVMLFDQRLYGGCSGRHVLRPSVRRGIDDGGRLRVQRVRHVHDWQPAAARPSRPSNLANIDLRHLIGSGGMGEVYLAEHQLLKRPCAIKVIRPGKARDPRALARFEREVRATARSVALEHRRDLRLR